uniref:ARAD1B20856p n=1 Tax=Blastobotrys adeninivorans TaxID=409370 RepID=A0A060T763_BLAAD
MKTNRRTPRRGRKPLAFLPSSPPGLNNMSMPPPVSPPPPGAGQDENSIPPWINRNNSGDNNNDNNNHNYHDSTNNGYDVFSSPVPSLSFGPSSPIGGASMHSPCPDGRALMSSPLKRPAALDEPFEPRMPMSSPGKRPSKRARVPRPRVSLVVENGRATVSSLIQDDESDGELIPDPPKRQKTHHSRTHSSSHSSYNTTGVYMPNCYRQKDDTVCDASVALRQTMARLQVYGGTMPAPATLFMPPLDSGLPTTPKLGLADLEFAQDTPSRVVAHTPSFATFEDNFLAY